MNGDEKNANGFCKQHSGVVVRIKQLEDTQQKVDTKLDRIYNRLTAFLISVILLLVGQTGYVVYRVIF